MEVNEINRNHNSHTRFYLELSINIYHDVVGVLCTQSEIQRDIQEIRNRVGHEGLSFLTKTLPRLGKSIDFALANGTCLHFESFKMAPRTRLPAFMREVLKHVFHTDGMPLFTKEQQTDSQSNDCKEDVTGITGNRRETIHYCRETAVNALKALRQVCFSFYKLELPYTNEQENKVINDFISVEAELRKEQGWADVEQTIAKTASRLIRRVLCNASPHTGIPRHGPGAVATGEKPDQKHRFQRYYTRLHGEFPYDAWFYLNSSHLVDSYEALQDMEEIEVGTAKVVLVPKDSRGPRLISCEPLEYQWIQQSLKSVLVDTIENHRLTRGHVNFTDQTINQRLALEGSTGTYPWATLDMKEASDRVSLALVKALFPPNWYDALYASRTSSTKLPDGTILPLLKFAPMGSAVCFPVEALVFWALSVSTLVITRGLSTREALNRVYVYGDDIICGSEDHVAIANALPKFGLMLNAGKCCTAGPFKESCGTDAFHGVSVTPVRLSTVWCHYREPSTLSSYAAFHNEAYERKWFNTSTYVERHLQNIWRQSIPIFSDRNPGVIALVKEDHVVSQQPLRVRTRWNADLHRREVSGVTIRPRTVISKVNGWELMLRVLLEAEHSQRRGKPPSKKKALFREPPPRRLLTGEYPIAHRIQPCRAWTVLL